MAKEPVVRAGSSVRCLQMRDVHPRLSGNHIVPELLCSLKRTLCRTRPSLLPGHLTRLEALLNCKAGVIPVVSVPVVNVHHRRGERGIGGLKDSLEEARELCFEVVGPQ